MVGRFLKDSYKWLCLQRKDHSPNSDIWDLRLNIKSLLPEIAFQIKKETYTLSPVKRIQIQGKYASLWASKDSLVLKAISLILEKKLPQHLSKRCTHLKSNGGLKGASKKSSTQKTPSS